MLTGYPELARAVGLDPLRMLDAAGIPRAALTDPDLRVPATALRDLLELSSRGAEDFGLRLVEMRTPSVMGPVTLIAREQPDVRSVLKALGRHGALHSEANSLSVKVVGEVAIISFGMRFSTPGPAIQAMDVTMAQVVRVLRTCLGANWRPLSVSFIHRPPASLEAYHRAFGPNITFNADFDGLVCPREDLDRPNPGADPEMARQVERYLKGLSTAAEAPPPERVRTLIRDLLPAGRATVEVVARRMGVDPRTLQRQLAAQETSFIELLQEVRMDLSGPYLEDSERPLTEVSELLGFSALSAFSRWHQTHYARSASDRRKAARAGRTGAA